MLTHLRLRAWLGVAAYWSLRSRLRFPKAAMQKVNLACKELAIEVIAIKFRLIRNDQLPCAQALN